MSDYQPILFKNKPDIESLKAFAKDKKKESALIQKIKEHIFFLDNLFETIEIGTDQPLSSQTQSEIRSQARETKETLAGILQAINPIGRSLAQSALKNDLKHWEEQDHKENKEKAGQIEKQRLATKEWKERNRERTKEQNRKDQRAKRERDKQNLRLQP